MNSVGRPRRPQAPPPPSFAATPHGDKVGVASGTPAPNDGGMSVMGATPVFGRKHAITPFRDMPGGLGFNLPELKGGNSDFSRHEEEKRAGLPALFTPKGGVIEAKSATHTAGRLSPRSSAIGEMKLGVKFDESVVKTPARVDFGRKKVGEAAADRVVLSSGLQNTGERSVFPSGLQTAEKALFTGTRRATDRPVFSSNYTARASAAFSPSIQPQRIEVAGLDIKHSVTQLLDKIQEETGVTIPWEKTTATLQAGKYRIELQVESQDAATALLSLPSTLMGDTSSITFTLLEDGVAEAAPSPIASKLSPGDLITATPAPLFRSGLSLQQTGSLIDQSSRWTNRSDIREAVDRTPFIAPRTPAPSTPAATNASYIANNTATKTRRRVQGLESPTIRQGNETKSIFRQPPPRRRNVCSKLCGFLFGF